MTNPTGNLLKINLTAEKWESVPYPPDMECRLLWGRSANILHLYRLPATPADPLDSNNPLILSCGLLTGLNIPTATRVHINALSPITGIIGSSNIGGDFGVKLSRAGVGTLIIDGAAETPVYLLITENGCEIRDANFLWGLDTRETMKKLKTVAGLERAGAITIGPAGENGVPFACIVSDEDHAAGRTGMGAVMGSKKLKAVVAVPGSAAKKAVVGPDVREAVNAYVRRILESGDYQTFKRFGSSGYVQWADERRLMSSYNFKERTFDAAEDIDGRKLGPFVRKSRGCPGCPVQCKAELNFKGPRFAGETAFRPEFEPMLNLGPKCGLKDPETLVYLDNLCTRLGLDSTSTAGVLAFAMDLYESGLLTGEDSGGMELRWGDGEVMGEVIRMISDRSGLGRILSLGVRGAAEEIGGPAKDYAAHVKGLELSAYHPAGAPGTALGYAVSSRGGDYNNVYASLEHRWSAEKAKDVFGTARAVDPESEEGKGRLIARAVIVNVVIDSLGLCKAPALSLIGDFDLEYEARIVSAVLKKTVSAVDLMTVGKRVADMERLINFRMNPDVKNDLPSMFFKDQDSPVSEKRFQRMLSDFYDVMGYDREGRPDEQKVNEWLNNTA